MTYSITEAAELLNVSPLTLRTWLAEARVDPETSPTDKRSRVLTHEQIEQLAKQHKRKVVLPSMQVAQSASAIQSLPDLLRQIAGLESRMSRQDDYTATIQALALVLRDENKRQNQDIEALRRDYDILSQTLAEHSEQLRRLEAILNNVITPSLGSNEG